MLLQAERIGRAPQQVEEFVTQYVQPFLGAYENESYTDEHIAV